MPHNVNQKGNPLHTNVSYTLIIYVFTNTYSYVIDFLLFFEDFFHNITHTIYLTNIIKVHIYTDNFIQTNANIYLYIFHTFY